MKTTQMFARTPEYLNLGTSLAMVLLKTFLCILFFCDFANANHLWTLKHCSTLRCMGVAMAKVLMLSSCCIDCTYCRSRDKILPMLQDLYLLSAGTDTALWPTVLGLVTLTCKQIIFDYYSWLTFGTVSTFDSCSL